jgi:FkbM family methyltransferase
MWIFCCGALRSGSTLQFNLAGELVERLGIGKRIKYYKPNEFPEAQESEKEYKGFKVFKTHVLTDSIKKEFLEGKAVGLYSYRDIRDVIVSLMHKNSVIYSEDDIQQIAEDYMYHYSEWMSVKKYLCMTEYANLYYHLEDEVERVAFFLGQKISKSAKIDIAKFLNIESQKGLLESSKNFTKIGNHKFEKNYLLHSNHINNGSVGQWKSQLSKKQLIATEKVSSDWLSSNNYKVAWPSLGIFISYSQHADDFIAWQLLGKKERGLVVEVGAFDGVHLSNSYSLEQLGWQSICIEPNPIIFSYLQRHRPNSTNIQVAITGDPTAQSVSFYAEEIGVLSGCTLDIEDVKRRYDARGLTYKAPKEIEVPASTLNGILEKQKVKPCEIDIVSIDVEGFEIAVLEGFDIEKYEPSLLIIEANIEKDKISILSHFSALKMYRFLGNNRQNLFFIKKSVYIEDFLDSLDLTNYETAIQRHPISPELTIQSVPPMFKKSDEDQSKRRSNILSRIIGRIR